MTTPSAAAATATARGSSSSSGGGGKQKQRAEQEEEEQGEQAEMQDGTTLFLDAPATIHHEGWLLESGHHARAASALGRPGQAGLAARK